MERTLEASYNALCEALLQPRVEIVMMRVWLAFSASLIGGRWLCGAIPLHRKLSDIVVI